MKRLKQTIANFIFKYKLEIKVNSKVLKEFKLQFGMKMIKSIFHS